MPDPPAQPVHWHDAQRGSVTSRLGWLRAGVLGANDGIVSTAGLVVGVAAATPEASAIATAGVAGLVAGAVSMALGEYVSVSAQRDSERAIIELERNELASMPEAELRELVNLLQERGLSRATSQQVASELTAHDALSAHLELELRLDREDLADPLAAAGSSAAAFTVGALLPLLAILAPPASTRIPVCVVAVLLALALTGAAGAHLGRAAKPRAMARLVLGGAGAMAATWAIGQLVGLALP